MAKVRKQLTYIHMYGHLLELPPVYNEILHCPSIIFSCHDTHFLVYVAYTIAWLGFTLAYIYPIIYVQARLCMHYQHPKDAYCMEWQRGSSLIE